MGGVELSCGNEPGLGLWQLWQAGSGQMPVVPFLELFFIHILLAQASGRRPGKCWCGAWQLERLLKEREHTPVGPSAGVH